MAPGDAVRVAAALQRDGVRPGDAIGICAASSVRYAALYLGALRAGFAYYRNIPIDQADNRATFESGFRLTMPVLALGGERGAGAFMLPA